MLLLTDRAQDLDASLKGLVREGLLGCVFSMLCVLFFFRNVRSTLLIAVTIPISLLATTQNNIYRAFQKNAYILFNGTH
ncbi:efflux RND transporter permease subunit [Paenibacillus solisilvae]|uniref:Efflux RND transporter permease subunit n=1 Tax=Paenibacillus solisilvae TaxID=2486751 RepID=A0ABW0VQU4_9BACL